MAGGHGMAPAVKAGDQDMSGGTVNQNIEILDGSDDPTQIRVRVNGVIQGLDEIQNLPKHKKHTIDIVVDDGLPIGAMLIAPPSPFGP